MLRRRAGGESVEQIHAQRLPEDSVPSAPCQVEHTAMCPSRPAAPISPALHRRRRPNEARRRRGEELYEADAAYTDE
ncbi:hypothetical protein [Streptomyces sp. NBC_00525]|uniref:hypothetical protein n=1 Tax=Streptomyces sp. NBC_00525 TaxID=2903660 RepID=UPI003FCCDB16